MITSQTKIRPISRAEIYILLVNLLLRPSLGEVPKVNDPHFFDDSFNLRSGDKNQTPKFVRFQFLGVDQVPPEVLVSGATVGEQGKGAVNECGWHNGWVRFFGT